MKWPERRLTLWLALATTVAAMASVSGEQQGGTEVVEAAAPPVRAARAETASAAAVAEPLRLDRLQRPVMQPESGELFASKSWYVPPPPPPPPVKLAPPPPTAPPLPFTYMGHLKESPERLVVFLVRGERLYTVSPGDVIDGTYRVEGVVGGQLSVTYLPLDIKQSIAMGDIS